ncbi:MAG: DUF1385 domain-containing protein [Candidatus Gracilibacteria bacterium]
MKNPENKIDFAIGGQAVIEGVMMRSPNFYFVSVRDPEGNIQSMQKSFTSITKKYKVLGLPVVRGVVNLVESMTIGFRALSYSNNVIFGGNEEPVVRGKFMTILYGFLSGLYVLFTLSVTIFLLKFLPLLVAQKISELWEVAERNYIVFNAIDGLTKITVFLSYILLISLLPDIKRVFEYHGAEHKSIWTYENGLDLTVENAKKQTRFHPRCGTSFIFLVILMSVFVYTVTPHLNGFWMNFFERLAVVPLIAGLSYELLKLSAKFQNNIFMKLLVAPGLLIQKLTTREPDGKQLEVALHSLKESLKAESVWKSTK